MEGALSARTLAVAADDIMYAIRLGYFFYACPPCPLPCAQLGNGERVLHVVVPTNTACACLAHFGTGKSQRLVPQREAALAADEVSSPVLVCWNGGNYVAVKDMFGRRGTKAQATPCPQ